MDPHVAGGAVAIFGVEHVVASGLLNDAGPLPPESSRAVVALQAHGKEQGTRQQPGVHRTVRHVAGLAAFETRGDMLEREWTAFIAMAFDAGLIVSRRLLDHVGTQSGSPGGGERAVRIMAIGALHEPFIDAVLEGHLELRADIRVAGVTEVHLPAREKELRSSGFVNRMAIRTDHIGLCMGRAPDIGA